MEVLTGYNAGTQLYTDGQGYLYLKTKTTGNRAYLSCYSTTCMARAVIEDNGYRLLSVHNEHEKPRDIIVVLKFRDRLRLDVEAYPERHQKPFLMMLSDSTSRRPIW